MGPNRDDLWTVAQTIYGEARGEPEAGKYAVAHVIANRARKHGIRPMDVCLQPYQFSCWLKSDPNRAVLGILTLERGSFVACLRVAVEVLADLHEDNTHGATHYYAVSIPAPEWAKGHTPCARIGNHLFFNDVS